MQNIPVPTIHLFPALEKALIELLYSLTPEEWPLPTIARSWNVKDVAAHLLDGNIRAIAMIRDNYFGVAPGNIANNQDLVNFLNGLNADWVNAMKRMSPKAMVDWMAVTGQQYSEQIASLDPFAPAMFAVSWAGEEHSLNWFHLAREYTERWHHQQQIRDAVGKPGMMDREFYYPVLDTFMMALPHTYRNTTAEGNTVLQLTISGEAGGDWFITKKDSWQLGKTNHLPVRTQINLPATIAWKLFTKSWRKKDVLDLISIDGDAALAEPALSMIAVMA